MSLFVDATDIRDRMSGLWRRTKHHYPPNKYVYGAHIRMSRLVKAPVRKVTLSETGMVTSLEDEREQEHPVACEKV